ncbi:MAG: hypothetical protein LBG73_00240 [Spirochaetaceae bacterium]|jgi:hypothetical protein|nr:hypothetical protein [Spirochaetaceae bacterium]
MPDYIPRGDEQFLLWAKNLVAYVQPKLTAFNIPAAALPPIQTELTNYETAFTAAIDPNRGKVDVLNKNESRDALKTDIRACVKAYLAYNPAVTDADKEHMGLPLHDATRSSAPVPKTIPELELDSSVIRQISVHFRDAGSDKRGKPAHVHGVELRWALLDKPPQSVEDLTKSAFDTASPYTFKFDETQRGRALYICPCWENNKGEKGPYGEIVKAIIP